MSTYSEILEQADRLGGLLERQKTAVAALAEEIRSRKITSVFLAARGTSDNAGRYANYLFGNRNRLLLTLAAPSLFTHYATPPDLSNALVLCISQSGESPDIVSVAEEGRRQGCLCAALTNVPGSPLADHVDHMLELGAGEERGVAATKTYTAELLLLAMLSAALTDDAQAQDELGRVPGWVRNALALDEMIAEKVQRYRYMEHCVVLGRGYNYATAFEWALKLKELTYIEAEPYSTADFMHGPVAMIERGFPVLVVAAKGAVLEDMLESQRFLRRELQAELVVISNVQDSLQLATTGFEFQDGVPEWLSPITAIVPAQLFAYHLTLAGGLDPDHPRTIHKVTLTT